MFISDRIMSISKKEFYKCSESFINMAGGAREAVLNVIESALLYNYIEILVPPFMVRQAAEKLKNSKTKIATMLDFPFGLSHASEKCLLIESMARAGAHIIDISPNVSAVRSGDMKSVEAEAAAVLEQSRRFKNLQVRFLVNEPVLSQDEKEFLAGFFRQKSVPFRILTQNSSSAAGSVFSFTGEFSQKIIRVNTLERSVRFEPLAASVNKLDERERASLFGRALCSAVICSEIDPKTPAGSVNKIVMSQGALASSGVTSSSSLAVGSKSPVSDGIKIMTRPCRAASSMAALGMRAIIVEGDARGYYYVLKFSKNSVEFLSGENLAGLNNYEMTERLARMHGDSCSFIISGPMAQKGSPASTISATDAAGNPDVQFGSGFGLLMNGLGVIAMVFDDSECKGPVEISSEKRPEYEKLVSEFNDAAVKDKTISEMLSPYGTPSFVMPLYDCGALPLARYEKFESANISKLSHQALFDLIQKRKGSCGVSCIDGCLVKCKNIFIDDKNAKTPYIEYEHVAQLGTMSEIFNFDVISKVLRYCREKGLDFSEIALAISEAIISGTQKGTPAEIAVACLSEIDKQSVLGKIILKGAYAAAISIGRGRALSISGEAMPPYDPRAIMGLGVSYITSSAGVEEKSQGYTAAGNVSKAGGSATGSQPEGQVEFSRNMQLAFHVMDTLGLCPNLIYPLIENQELWNSLVKIIALRYNIKLNFPETARLAKKLIKEENAFNKACGRENIRTKLPAFFYSEANEKTQSVFSVNDEAVEKIFEAW